MAASVLFILLGVAVICIKSQRGDLHYSTNLENDGNTVVLGGLFPMHVPGNDQPCGEFQEIGVEQVEAMVFAINTINKDPNLLPNVTLGFSIRDTCTTPSHALQQAFKYVQNANDSCSVAGNRIAVSGVVGAQYSSVSIDIANLLRLHKIPQISHASSSDVLSDKTRFDYFFRTAPPNMLQAKAIADIIIALKWEYVFAIYSDDAFGRGGIDAVLNELADKVCIAALIPLSVTAVPSDYDAALRNMSKEWVRNASIAVLFVHLDEAVGMMKGMRRFRNGPYRDTLRDITWLGIASWGDSLPPEYHAEARGMLTIATKSLDIPDFDNYFASLHPTNYTDNVWFEEFWERRFNCSLSNLTNVAPCDLADESIALTAEEHRLFTRATLILDAVMAFAHAIHNLINSTCSDNRLCPAVLVNKLTGQAVNGELLREHLSNVSFIGPSTNLVTFNNQGNILGAYFIKNLKTVSAAENRYTFEVVGTWHESETLNISIENIEWVINGSTPPESICSRPCKGGYQPIPVAKQQCCWVCSQCQSVKGVSNGVDPCWDCNETDMPNEEKDGCVPIPITFLSYADIWAVVLILLSLVGLLATIFISIIFVIFRKHKVIKASSREVSTILLVGIFLCYVMPFFIVAMPSDAICAIRRFGVGFSFSICFSALLIKTNRIFRIFNLHSLKPQKAPPLISPLSQVLLTFALIAIQILIAVIWLAVETPSTKTQYFTRYAEKKCGESPITGLSITLSYNFLLLLLSTYFAFRARKVPENFNEAKYINVTLYTLCIVWLAFIPTYFVTAELKAVFQTLSLSLAILLSATTTLACLFVPKLFLLVSYHNKENEIIKAPSDVTTTISIAKFQN